MKEAQSLQPLRGLVPALIPEAERLAELRSVAIMDTSPEVAFDDLLGLASQICGVSKGAITFVDESRVFQKAVIGLTASDVPRNISFCDHTIRQEGALVVEDVRLDPRFRDNLLLRSAGIRFYAGVPLSITAGAHLGALCVMADEPRELTELQEQNLHMLARQIGLLLNLRSGKNLAERLMKQLTLEQTLFTTLFDNTPVESCLKDPSGHIVLYNQAFAKRFGITSDQWIGKSSYDLWPQPVADRIAADEKQIRLTGTAKTTYVAIPAGDSTTHWRSTKVPCLDIDEKQMLLCFSVDVTEEVVKQHELERAKTELQKASLQMQALLNKDDLTGLNNRRSFEASCLAALLALRDRGTRFAVVAIEVGALALRNRMYGPSQVDDMLRSVAQSLREQSSSSEVAARIAGGSFRVLLNDASSSSASVLAHRIETNLFGVTWEGRIISPAITYSLFSDSEMNAAELFATPTKLLRGTRNAKKNPLPRRQTKFQVAGVNAENDQADVITSLSI